MMCKVCACFGSILVYRHRNPFIEHVTSNFHQSKLQQLKQKHLAIEKIRLNLKPPEVNSVLKEFGTTGILAYEQKWRTLVGRCQKTKQGYLRDIIQSGPQTDLSDERIAQTNPFPLSSSAPSYSMLCAECTGRFTASTKPPEQLIMELTQLKQDIEVHLVEL